MCTCVHPCRFPVRSAGAVFFCVRRRGRACFCALGVGEVVVVGCSVYTCAVLCVGVPLPVGQWLVLLLLLYLGGDVHRFLVSSSSSFFLAGSAPTHPAHPSPTLLDLPFFGVVFLCVGVGKPQSCRSLGVCRVVACFLFPYGGVCTYLPLQGTPLPSGRLYVCSAGAV